MYRKALEDLNKWWITPQTSKQQHARKPLVLRGARQVGKSFLVRDFCQRQGLVCHEINFEKEPSLRQLFIEGENSKTISLLEVHFRKRIDEKSLLFLDEIQAAPEVFARLRYFFEDSPHVAVIAAGSLLEFTLAEIEYSVPVGRIEYLHLGPMSFEEFLMAQDEERLLESMKAWQPNSLETDIPEPIHNRLLSYVHDFSIVGGMPEAVARFLDGRDFLGCESVQRSILETYREDFGKYRKRIPLDRLERVFISVPSQVGKKWVHARISPNEKAQSIEAVLEALCKAKVVHRVFHSSGNGVPLAAERKDNLFKIISIDVGLVSTQLGLRITDLTDPSTLIRVNEGTIAEQWIGQHLLDLRPFALPPELHYWVREKQGALAEVDYLYSQGTRVYPIEVKAGSSTQAKSLQVFLSEKKQTLFGIHFSVNRAEFLPNKKILRLPFYLIEQLPRLLNELQKT